MRLRVLGLLVAIAQAHAALHVFSPRLSSSRRQAVSAAAALGLLSAPAMADELIVLTEEEMRERVRKKQAGAPDLPIARASPALQ